MKNIIIDRGGQKEPKVLISGDKYDSVLTLYDNDKELMKLEYVNTDHSLTKEGGVLAEGKYGGIVFNRPKNKGKAILLYDYKYFDKISTINEVWKYGTIVPSLVGNPNHNNKKVMESILIHKGGTSEWDWSEGCITVYGLLYDSFISLFEMDEKVIVTLTRNTNFNPPSFYNGK